MARHLRNSATRERFVLLHYHIFKNAGSTVEFMLERNFGDAFVTLHGIHDESVISCEEIVDLVTQDATIAAISSHHFRYPKPSACRIVFHDICFIRNPLDRIRSLYHYARKLQPTEWLSTLANAHDEPNFVAKILEQRPNQISNWQVNFLAKGGSFSHPIGANDLDKAVNVLLDTTLLGVTGSFDESLVAGEFFLRWAYPDIDLAYVPQNVSTPDSHRATSDDQRFEACRHAWGTELFDAVDALNVWDSRLYAAAHDEVHRRFSVVPQRDARLSAFRARCASLRR